MKFIRPNQTNRNSKPRIQPAINLQSTLPPTDPAIPNAVKPPTIACISQQCCCPTNISDASTACVLPLVPSVHTHQSVPCSSQGLLLTAVVSLVDVHSTTPFEPTLAHRVPPFAAKHSITTLLLLPLHRHLMNITASCHTLSDQTFCHRNPDVTTIHCTIPLAARPYVTTIL
jgi:hypothetical protein